MAITRLSIPVEAPDHITMAIAEYGWAGSRPALRNRNGARAFGSVSV